jgi:hypothetical protein
MPTPTRRGHTYVGYTPDQPPQQQAAMTNLREQHEGIAVTAEPEPEAIEDLDVTGDDADAVAGGIQAETTDSNHKD